MGDIPEIWPDSYPNMNPPSEEIPPNTSESSAMGCLLSSSAAGMALFCSETDTDVSELFSGVSVGVDFSTTASLFLVKKAMMDIV